MQVLIYGLLAAEHRQRLFFDNIANNVFEFDNLQERLDYCDERRADGICTEICHGLGINPGSEYQFQSEKRAVILLSGLRQAGVPKAIFLSLIEKGLQEHEFFLVLLCDHNPERHRRRILQACNDLCQFLIFIFGAIFETGHCSCILRDRSGEIEK